MAERLPKEYLAPNGRLIVTPGPKTEHIADLLRAWGYEVAGRSRAADTNGTVITRVAWTDAPG
jgi:hypothetical protein